MASRPHPYVALLEPRASDAARTWWQPRYEALSEGSFTAAFASSGRRIGATPITLGAEELAALRGAGLPDPTGWPLSGLARVCLLLRVCERSDPERHVPLVAAQLKTGDNAEREAVLRALPLLPEPKRFVDIAIDACRTHVQTVFEAIACENAYPARYFPEHNFNQMVLKAVFTGVALRRIVGLEARTTPELRRMASAYASERRAAGRPVPEDLSLITAADLPPLGAPGAKP